MTTLKGGLLADISFTEDTTDYSVDQQSRDPEEATQDSQQNDGTTLSMEPQHSRADSVYEESEDEETDAQLSQFTLTSQSTATRSRGRRKRRGDDSSAYSEESVASQKRRLDSSTTTSGRFGRRNHRHSPTRANNTAVAADGHLRWLENSTRTTQSDAPLKPQRSGDFDFMPTYRRAITTGNTATITSGAAVGDPVPLGTMRSQSMCAPPVRPIRTSDDSDTDLKLSPLPRSPAKDSRLSTLNKSDEYDPDMFARLLRGGPLNPLSPAKGRRTSLDSSNTSNNDQIPALATGANAVSTDPPKRPSRSSDAEYYFTLFQKQQLQEKEWHHRHHRSQYESSLFALSSTAPPLSNTAFSPCITSPKPPAKPQRVVEDIDDIDSMRLPPAVLKPHEPPVSIPSSIPENEVESLPPSFDNAPGLFAAECVEEKMEIEDISTPKQQNQNEENYECKDKSFASPSQEYDPDLFNRLLHGEACGNIQTETLITRQTSMEVMAKAPNYKHSSGYTCDRFDNGHCTSKEHLEGQMKSSHPPMRPRRSFDEGMMAFENGAALADAAAAAVLYHAEVESRKESICIIGGKRRYRRHSRRSTMPLAGTNRDSVADKCGDGQPEPYEFDPTQEVEFNASSKGEDAGLLAEESPVDTADKACQLDARSGLPIQQEKRDDNPKMPRVRRRMTRRFTMPSKCRAPSPLTKKPRIARSTSAKEESHQTERNQNSPAA